MGELNIGSERIITVIQCNVKSDPEEFKNWIKDRASKYVYELKEENTISYEWFLSNDGNKATLVYTNSDATVQRFKNHGASPIANEVVEFVDFEAVYCFGNPKDDLKRKCLEHGVLGAWGAIIQNHFCGFNHS